MKFLTRQQLLELDLVSCGKDVNISERAVLYNPEKMSFGSHVRVDDFAILHTETFLNIGSYVHVGAFAMLAGRHGITMGDFSGVGARVSVFTGSHDFSGEVLASAIAPPEYNNDSIGPVHIGRHAIVCSHAVVLPDLTIHDGAVVGAHALVATDLAEWTIHAGAPARPIKARSRDALAIGERLIAAIDDVPNRRP
jgi:dTDP-4-amino-4,6-dideoxy-D-glucose acyltransferase